MIRGTPKIDGLALGEIRVSFLSQTLEVYAKAAFVSTASGETHGFTEGRGAVWSKATIAKLTELAASMENDLAIVHMQGMSERLDGPVTGNEESGGLMEHLGDAKPA